MDDGDGLVGVWVAAGERGEGGVQLVGGRGVGDGKEDVRCTCAR